MVVLNAENISLPSVNKKYNYNPKVGKLFLAKEYREACKILKILMRKNCGVLQAPYEVIINVETYLDIDNFLKPLFDVMQELEIIGNDRDIIRLEVNKKPSKRGSLNKLRVEVNSYGKR